MQQTQHELTPATSSHNFTLAAHEKYKQPQPTHPQETHANMFKSMPLLILSILAATSSAQLANAPERVREAKNDAIVSSNGESGRRSPSANLRNGRVLQQSMSMETDVDKAEEEAELLGYYPLDPNLQDCDIGNQACPDGETCLIPHLGLLCNPIVTVPFYCEGKCVPVPLIPTP
mmetsp:Transcript_19153/g.45995  ORF Transcript_19153/g.45995 Transcript_19153/m.45995 type:complete len:175 (-) Transcript_19153:33-557(-)